MIFVVGEASYGFTPDNLCPPGDFDVNIYAVDSLRERVERFVNESWFGCILGQLGHCIDKAAKARDLSCDHTKIVIAVEYLIYRVR